MEEFNTLEKVTNLFKNMDCVGNKNCYFICYRDTTKESIKYGAIGGALGGALGGAIAGAINSFSTECVNGMEKFDGYLFNWTDTGIGIIPLKYKGVMLTVNPSKMQTQIDKYRFIKNEDIESIIVQKFNVFNSKVKKIKITFKDEKSKMYLIANMKEKLIPYQEDNFVKFVNEYNK